MIINTIEEMETIVNKNKSLFWDGWTVVHTFRSDKGRTSKYGAYINNKWHIVKRFDPSRNGWDIPDRIIKNG